MKIRNDFVVRLCLVIFVDLFRHGIPNKCTDYMSVRTVPVHTLTEFVKNEKSTYFGKEYIID